LGANFPGNGYRVITSQELKKSGDRMRGFVGSSVWPVLAGAAAPGIRRAIFAAFGLLGVVLVSPLAPSAFAQSGDPKAQEQAKQPAGPTDAAKDNQKKAADEFADAARTINGPAGNPECVWLGRRVVTLMWRDDLDTAFRHLDLYDRFGCPGGHIQATFRCMARTGGPDAKPSSDINKDVQTCWVNPAAVLPVGGSPVAAPAAPAK
jgi:hypothetical protein